VSVDTVDEQTRGVGRLVVVARVVQGSIGVGDGVNCVNGGVAGVFSGMEWVRVSISLTSRRETCAISFSWLPLSGERVG
jgi:hypothetical protein